MTKAEKQGNRYVNIGNVIAAGFVLSFFTYYIYVSQAFDLVVGYGGDLLGLSEHLANREIFFSFIRPWDTGTKILATNLTPSGKSEASVLVFLTFFCHFGFSFASAAIFSAKHSIFRDVGPIFFVIVAFEPLTISLILSGHITFIPSLSLILAFCFIYSTKPNLVFVISLIALLFVNAYLLFHFVLFCLFLILCVHYFDDTKQNIRSFVPSLLILTALFALKLVSALYGHSIFDLIDGMNSLDSRGAASGIFPINILIPDTLSVASSPFLTLKNETFTYLNVPESNHFLGYAAIPLLYLCARSSIKTFLVFTFTYCLLLLFFAFPPHTSSLGNPIFFPSWIYANVFPELRVLSRNVVAINVCLLLATVFFLKVKNGDVPFWIWALLVLQIPINFFPVSITQGFDETNLPVCESNYVQTLVSEEGNWDQIYCSFYEKLELNSSCQIKVLNHIDERRNLALCRMEAL